MIEEETRIKQYILWGASHWEKIKFRFQIEGPPIGCDPLDWIKKKYRKSKPSKNEGSISFFMLELTSSKQLRRDLEWGVA